MEPIELQDIPNEVFLEDIQELTQAFPLEFSHLFQQIKDYLGIEEKNIYITDFVARRVCELVHAPVSQAKWCVAKPHTLLVPLLFWLTILLLWIGLMSPSCQCAIWASLALGCFSYAELRFRLPIS